MNFSLRSRDFLAVILCLQIIAYGLVFFDIPIARQVFGFVYFTFVPGFIIVKLLKFDEFGKLETLLFSAGFSVAFLMFGGLLINEFGFLFGISQPLSLMPLIAILNILILIGGLLVYLRNEGRKLLETKTLAVSPLTALLAILPILTVVGAMWVNAFGNSLILLLVLIIISLVFVIGTIFHKLPAGFYPIAIFAIALSLLLHTSLISQYLSSFGSDNPIEYFVFKTTENNLHWSSGALEYGRFNSMLSVTILPTIYSILLNIDATNVFKILYPLLFALVPLALYQLWQKNFGKKTAFVAAFLLMAQLTFYFEMLGLNRQMVAELFFVLLLLTIVGKMKSFNKIVCFSVFGFALVVSHYSLAVLFLFLISFVWLFILIVKKQVSRNLPLASIVLFSVIMFFWYLFTSGSASFNSVLEFGGYVQAELGNFFDLASRGTGVLSGLGLAGSPSILNTISRAFAYITELFIVAGFIGLIRRRKNDQLKNEYFTFVLIAVVFLVALIVVPGLAETLNITRFYHILLFFLAPLCVVGVENLVKLVSKRRTELCVSIILVMVLVPYFLFQTNFVYEVTGSESWSLPLSKYRMEGYMLYRRMGYIPEENVFGANWLAEYAHSQNTQIYAGIDSQHKVLLAYGLIMRSDVTVLSNITRVENNGIIYFSKLTVVDGIIDGDTGLWNSSDVSFIFNDTAKIYSNGGCEIYKSVAPVQDG